MADNHEIRNIKKIEVKVNKKIKINLLFDRGSSLIKKKLGKSKKKLIKMIKVLFILICLCILANYIILHLKAIKTDKDLDNDQNFWMFSYDFKEKKRDSIFDREPEDIIKEKKKKK